MRGLLGLGWFAANVFVFLLLRARDQRERAIIRFPGAWIPVGLLLTSSFAGSIAVVLLSLGLLR